MINTRSPLVKTAAVAGVAILAGLVAAFAVGAFPPRPPGGAPNVFLVTLIRVKLFVTTLNVVMLLALTASYVLLYRDLPNQYTRSLVALSFALLLYALSSHPFVPFLFGFPPKPDLGLFVFLPDLFVSAAIIVLYYQSQT